MAWVAQRILIIKSVIYKGKMGKFDVIKITKFLSSKDNCSENEKVNHTLGENICKNIYLIKDLCQGYINSTQNTNIKRIKFFQYKIGKNF